MNMCLATWLPIPNINSISTHRFAKILVFLIFKNQSFIFKGLAIFTARIKYY